MPLPTIDQVSSSAGLLTDGLGLLGKTKRGLGRQLLKFSLWLIGEEASSTCVDASHAAALLGEVVVRIDKTGLEWPVKLNGRLSIDEIRVNFAHVYDPICLKCEARTVFLVASERQCPACEKKFRCEPALERDRARSLAVVELRKLRPGIRIDDRV